MDQDRSDGLWHRHRGLEKLVAVVFSICHLCHFPWGKSGAMSHSQPHGRTTWQPPELCWWWSGARGGEQCVSRFLTAEPSAATAALSDGPVPSHRDLNLRSQQSCTRPSNPQEPCGLSHCGLGDQFPSNRSHSFTLCCPWNFVLYHTKTFK